MIAEVIVDISNSSVDKIYDYNVSSDIKTGTRVWVPFGNRNIMGFVINIKQQSQLEKSKLKSVISQIDEMQIISDEMIDIMHEMVKKYNLKYIDCLKLFIPSEMRTGKVNPLSKTLCWINDKIDIISYEKSLRKNAKNQIALLNLIKDGIKHNKSELCSSFSNSAVQKFVTDKVIICGEVEFYREPQFNEVEDKSFTLTEHQKQAIDKIIHSQKPCLLFGVTGSGKTEVYMNVIAAIIKAEKTAIMLVPEISLTPQMLSSLKAKFKNDVAILHSGLSAGERFDEWRRLLCGDAKIAVGARSAIFAPLKNVGVIIIDEEHENSYVSETNPRYNAADIAQMRSNFNNCPLVLASATPSLNSYYNVNEGKFELAVLPKRVNGKEMPKIQVVDMVSEIRNGNSSMFSVKLIDALKEVVANNMQAMIFINRRGYSSFMRCSKCGYVAKCSDCDVSLVYHKHEEKLKCHYCGKRFNALTVCPECKSENIRQGAIGTETVVQYLHNLFPTVKILRMDNDSTRTKNAHSKILTEFANAHPAFLVGTQMIAKGHDFKDVTLVGIVDADQSLYQSNYKSTERTFQLLTQMAGRAGREENSGTVILQTYAPNHYAYKFISNYDYAGFYKKEINIREVTKFPPFSVIVRLLFSSENEESVKNCTKLCYNDIKELKQHTSCFLYLDVMKSPIGKIKNKTRFQILARLNVQQSETVIKQMYAICEKYQSANVSVFVEINPENLS